MTARAYAVTRGWIQAIAEYLRHREHVRIGLEPCGNRPQHLFLIEDIHVVINRNHKLEIWVEAKKQHQRMTRLSVGGLLHRHVGMEMGAGFRKVQRLEVWHHFLQAHMHMRLFGGTSQQ